MAFGDELAHRCLRSSARCAPRRQEVEAMTEIDYAEYVNTGDTAGQSFTVTAQFPQFQDFPGLAIVVPPQSTRYEVVGFVPVVQSRYEQSELSLRILEVGPGGSLQTARITVQTLPQAVALHRQTFGPLSVRRRFGPNPATLKYLLQVARSTVGVLPPGAGHDWSAVIDDSGANVAFLLAETI